MKIGKVSNELLQSAIFDKILHKRSEVVVRPNIGEDCSVLEFAQNENIVLSTDPITGATQHIGKLAVHISCNDVSTSGAEPVGILVTILLPPGSREEDFKTIMEDITRSARESNIEIIGGHTEITDAVTRPVVSTTVIGKVKKEHMVATKGALVGQDIILTKWAGLEGTAILANEYEEVLTKKLGKDLVLAGKKFGDYLSVVPESQIARKCKITSMHDATEGGILGAIWEVAECAKVGVTIQMDKILVKEATQKICEVFEISPYHLISSGCMIMTTFEGEKCLEELAKLEITANIIGKITKDGKYMITDGIKEEIQPPESDDLYKAFQKSL
ncbi:MAG TPA: AIR synthase [Epulopiscium sp.]|nr:AIR synthase [Candidatus Epulonipiscium sp.]